MQYCNLRLQMSEQIHNFCFFRLTEPPFFPLDFCFAFCTKCIDSHFAYVFNIFVYLFVSVVARTFLSVTVTFAAKTMFDYFVVRCKMHQNTSNKTIAQTKIFAIVKLTKAHSSNFFFHFFAFWAMPHQLSQYKRNGHRNNAHENCSRLYEKKNNSKAKQKQKPCQHQNIWTFAPNKWWISLILSTIFIVDWIACIL